MDQTKPCKRCLLVQPLSAFSLEYYGHRHVCRTCRNKDRLEQSRKSSREYNRRWAKQHGYARSTMQRRRLKSLDPDKYKQQLKAMNLKRNYSLTIEQYNALLLEQNNVCKICKQASTKTLHVDHCHTTGKVRGLLCGNCNAALGHIKDNLDTLNSMKTYLLWNMTCYQPS